MPEVRFKHIVSCNSAESVNPADNLLAPAAYKKWRCLPGEKQAVVVIQLERESRVHSLDIGNEHSAFVEVLVGRSADAADQYHVLLPASSFMNPTESRQGQGFNRVRMFSREQLSAPTVDAAWDRLKIVCTQPFNKSIAYGLAFVRVLDADAPTTAASPAAATTTTTTRLGQFALRDDGGPSAPLAGSMFNKRKLEVDAPSKPPATPPAAAKEALSTFKELQAKRPRSRSPDTPQKPPPRAPVGGAAAAAPSAQNRTPTHPSKPVTPAPKPPVAPPPAAKKRAVRRAPFNQLLADVTFVLSGFENPLRSTLRSEALAMGAVYKADWAPGCTHLVCAFANTPKYRQVKGSGKIVRKEWLSDCHRNRRRLPWRRYAMDKAEMGRAESGDEVEADDGAAAARPLPPVASKPAAASPHPNGSSAPPSTPPAAAATAYDRADYDASTDDNGSSGGDTDDEIDKSRDGRQAPSLAAECKVSPGKLAVGGDGLPRLPDFLAGMTFLLYGDLAETESKQLRRFATAFGGRVAAYMGAGVTHVLTRAAWDAAFDAAAADNAALLFVNCDWLLECGRTTQLVDLRPFLIVKP